jgi:cellulose synthase/poly-beta-1,6-N-acetylglucosamine synthase-like glycosyltransferase
VSVLIVGHNEEAMIRARIENLLALDYPAGALELVVASDGSSDRTVEIVRQYEGRGVRLIPLPARRGKAAALNAVVPTLRGDVVVLSDANTMTDPMAVRNLARWFSDPAVGVVCGKLILFDPVSGQNVDSVYWRYETFLKVCEGRLGALLGANGAIYAIRKSVFGGIPSDTIVDDFVIPLLARLRTGCTIVYDAAATALEETPKEISSEFKRRARIGAGDFQSIPLLWPLLDPRLGWIAFTFFSHKLLRWFCPFFLLGAAVSNVLLADAGVYGLCLAIQVGVYGIAFAGRFLSPGPGAAGKAMRLATMFTAMNAALFVGFFRWATGRQNGMWERTAR